MEKSDFHTKIQFMCVLPTERLTRVPNYDELDELNEMFLASLFLLTNLDFINRVICHIMSSLMVTAHGF